MTQFAKKLGIYLAGLALFGAFSVAQATSEFAEIKYVLQISDNDPSKQTLVLNVANNIVKHYGPDRVAVEVVAFGPGLRLMFASNDNASRIDGLSANGVEFAACGNTLKRVTQLRDGEAPQLNASANVVPAGVVRIGELTQQGYILVKP